MPHIRNRQTSREETEAAYRNWDEYDSPDTDTAYEDLIQRDPTVCDNCFQKCFTEVTREWYSGTFGWSDYNRWVPHPDCVSSIPADNAAQGVRLTCANCGHRTTQIRPVSKARIDDCIQNLSKTLALKGIKHSATVLEAEVHDRNTPENQGRQDYEVFRPAVIEAIRAVNLRPQTSASNQTEARHG